MHHFLSLPGHLVGLIRGRYDRLALSSQPSSDRIEPVGKYEKLLDQILHGASDAGIPFDALRRLLLRLGFIERIRGSHHVFRREGVAEKINLQKDGSKAKAYQVRQVRAIILRYNLRDET